MQEKDSLQVLEKIETGMFCKVGLPLTHSKTSDVISVYLGKDKQDRYNFYGGKILGTYKMTDKFIIRQNIKISKIDNEEKEKLLYQILRKQEIRDKHRAKESR